MAVLTTTALVLGGIAAAGAVYSGVQQSKAASAQRKAIRAQQRQADIANARERRQAVRQSRILRASVESQGALSGLQGSSALSASMSNVTSRTNENLSFMDQNQQLSAQASAANNAAAAYASRASYGQTVTNLSMAAMNMYTGPKPQGTG